MRRGVLRCAVAVSRGCGCLMRLTRRAGRGVVKQAWRLIQAETAWFYGLVQSRTAASLLVVMSHNGYARLRGVMRRSGCSTWGGCRCGPAVIGWIWSWGDDRGSCLYCYNVANDRISRNDRKTVVGRKRTRLETDVAIRVRFSQSRVAGRQPLCSASQPGWHTTAEAPTMASYST